MKLLLLLFGVSFFILSIITGDKIEGLIYQTNGNLLFSVVVILKTIESKK